MSGGRADEVERVLAGGGEMGAVMRAVDWGKSPVGEVGGWPRALKVAVRVLLDCRLPMYLAWGRELTQFYNDAYRPILGDKHPAMGRSAPAVWPEIWGTVGPMFAEVLGGKSFGFPGFKLTIERYGYPEDCYFDFSYSPVPDDEGRPAGVLVTFVETTEKVVNERRLQFLSDLGDATRDLADPEEVMRVVAEMLGKHLGASRCAYAEVEGDSERFAIRHDYRAEGVGSTVGEYRLSQFGERAAADQRGGRTLVIHDVNRELGAASEGAGTFSGIGIKAVVCCPLVRDGRLVAMMAVHQAAPRRWRDDEVRLVEAVVERSWAYIERARASRALRESEERFRAAFDQSVVGIVLTDLDGRVRRANGAFCALVGRSCEELEGRTSAGYTHPEDVGRNVDNLARIKARSASDSVYEKRYVRPDGAVVHAMAHVSAVRGPGGEPVGLIAIVEDITDRKRAEGERDRLLASERAAREEVETLARVGQLVSAELDLHALVQRVTDETTGLTRAQFGAFFYNVINERGESYSLYTLSGVAREKFEGFPMPRATEVFGPTFRGEGVVRLEDVTKDPRYGRNQPYYGMPKGHLPVRSYLAVPVVSRSGEVLGGLFFGHERVGVFTERDERLVLGVAAQAAVAIDNARLYEAARRANAAKDELLESERAARSEAERAGRMKDEFLTTLSHELRTPLNAIVGWSQILRGGQAGPEDVREGIATIERNARAQAQIIEDLLDMSRIVSGKLRLDVQRVDLAEVVRAGVETVRPAAEAKGVRLGAVVDPLAGPVSGDPNRLQQVLWNLLSNAVKFTPRGGQVRAVLERVNSHVEVSVTDTGEGIRPEFLPHVFDRFRQADSSTTRRHGGLGLGLSIAKQLVEMHGGSVRVKSAGEGQGSTFTVALPLMVVHPPDDEGDRRHPRGGGGVQGEAGVRLDGVRVLVVDDEPDARLLVKRVLEECEAEVRVAGSGGEALEAMREFRADVLVSDIGMPGEDGYSLISKVRRMAAEDGGDVPAVALTAYARAEDRIRALRSGFQMHVVKPVEPAELLAVVASLAGRVG